MYSISAGLDYPGIGPEHAWLHDTGRAQYVPVTDDEAVDAFEYLSRMEGIIPAIESAHAVALCLQDRAEDEQRSNHGSHAFWSWRQGTAPQLPVTEEKISMSNPRIKAAFKGWQAFIPFVTCGDPSLEATKKIIAELCRQALPLSSWAFRFPTLRQKGR